MKAKANRSASSQPGFSTLDRMLNRIGVNGNNPALWEVNWQNGWPLLENEMNHDEVLKLCEAAGIKDLCNVFPGHIGNKVIKLIALSKAAAYEDAASLLESSCPPEVYVWVAAEKIRNRANEVTK